MGLFDSLNELAKKGETLVQAGSEISKAVVNIAQETSKAVTSSPAKEPHSKQKPPTSMPDKKVVTKRSENALACEILEECRIRPIMDLMTKLNNPAALAVFETPHRLSDTLEILAFLRNRTDLKKLHQRIFKDACSIFENDQYSLEKIYGFKPKNIFGF